MLIVILVMSSTSFEPNELPSNSASDPSGLELRYHFHHITPFVFTADIDGLKGLPLDVH